VASTHPMGSIGLVGIIDGLQVLHIFMFGRAPPMQKSESKSGIHLDPP
jgi:hypothetical protein